MADLIIARDAAKWYDCDFPVLIRDEWNHRPEPASTELTAISLPNAVNCARRENR